MTTADEKDVCVFILIVRYMTIKEFASILYFLRLNLLNNHQKRCLIQGQESINNTNFCDLMKSIENVDNFDPVESNEEMIGECSNLLT